MAIIGKIKCFGWGGDLCHSECLFYKTPYRGKDAKAKALGMILVKRVSKGEKCLFENKSISEDVLEEIEKFKIFFSNYKILAKKSKREIQPF